MKHYEGGALVRMVVIADDITGAFDTGVQFAKRNAAVHVLTGEHTTQHTFEREADVLVIDAETRHMSAEEAYQETKRLAGLAYAHGVTHLYIKTDSGLRGNIAQAFAGAMEAWQCNFAAFAPAYPAMNRLTVDGVQFIDDIPLEQSVYGSDLFNPVSASKISNLFMGSALHTKNYAPHATIFPVQEPTVGIFDVREDADFYDIAHALAQRDSLRVTGGCAAFAAALADYLQIGTGSRQKMDLSRPIFTVCGSLNPISLRQLDWEEAHGGTRIHLKGAQLLAPGYLESDEGMNWLQTLLDQLDDRKHMVLDSCDATLLDARPFAQAKAEQMRNRVASRLGEIVARLIELGVDQRYTLFIIGGDTLMGFLQQMQHPEISLLDEVTPGVVLFCFQYQAREVVMLSKSGGFGADALLEEIGSGALRKVSGK